MIRIIFYAFLLYLAYKLVFGLIIPVYRTTRKVKRGFMEMQEKMQQQQQQAGGYNSQPADNTTSNKTSQVGDYIDFEEVK